VYEILQKLVCAASLVKLGVMEDHVPRKNWLHFGKKIVAVIKFMHLGA